jgi:hypothetical protein
MILKISSSSLLFGMQNDDVARVHRALQALGRIKNVPVTETRDRVLGAGTVAVLKALQADLGLPASGIVDAATVKAINVELAKLATNQRVVRGSVRAADGDPVTAGFVQIVSQSSNGEVTIGKSPLHATDGSYEIAYLPPPESNGRVNLRVAVLNDSGPVETTPSGASILTNAGPLEVVNFVLSGEANQPLSEFELIVDDLKPLLGDRTLDELTEEPGRPEISLLAIRSGYIPEQVTALVVAHKHEKETGIPAQVFYGFLRQGLPQDVNALHATNPSARLVALQASTEQGIVPKEVGGKKIEDHLPGFVPSPASELQGLLGRILNADELHTFVDQYLKDSQNPDAFWQRIAADPVWADRAGMLKRTVQFGVLFNNQEGLVKEISAIPDIVEAADLARLTKDDWKALVETQGVGVPADTPGADAEEKTQNYVRQIIDQVEAAFPTRFLAERLSTFSPVAEFLKNNQHSFDLKTTYPEQFFKKNPDAAQELTPQSRHELSQLSRVYRLTENAEVTNALAQKGVGSAQQIARMDPKIFAEQNQEILSADRAREVYERARQTNAIAMALLGEHSAGLNRTGLQALPKLDTQKQKEEAQNDTAENGIPNWETLFGAFDLCACQECSSVHGPAAYFVDILQFLKERGVKDALFDRRPDLGDIELSCENTNTVLPLIDLVNEILENAVAPPPPFAPLTLAPALEVDLGQTIATAALAAAFTPPLQPGARVETLEAETRWRIWDEPFAYSVAKENDVLTVVARSRQTSGSAGERRATPQYRNGAAYSELGQAVYPWHLPFDLPTEEAHVFLKHLGVARRDLIEALRPAPEDFDPNSPVTVRLAAERLGLTDTERKIIVDEPLEPPRQPEHFWDSAPVEALKTVRELLDRSGLSFAELEAMLSTWFINPDKTLHISAKPNEPVATCDTTKLQINNLTTDVLSRIHRFVRLWRELGWAISEVDQAIRAFVPDPAPPSLTNEVLVRLDHLAALRSQLRITVGQALALWRLIDTEGPESLYARLFYNPAVFKPQEEEFRLRPDGKELVHADRPLAGHAATLQAVFRLNPESFALLVAKTDGKLTLGNLSHLYRHAILARQLGLPVQDLLTALDLTGDPTGLDPFKAERTQDTLRFVEVVRAIRHSGFDFAALDYLIRHRFNPEASFVPAESSLGQTLTEVRAGLLEVKAQSEAERKKLRDSSDSLLFRVSDLKDIANLAVRLRGDTDPLSQSLRVQFSPDTQQLLEQYDSSSSPSESLQRALTNELNRLLQGPSLFNEQRFAHVKLTEETQRLITQNPQGDGLIRLNRLLLDEAYPREMAISQSLVIDRVAAALSLPADVTGVLLGRVSHVGETALQRFLALSAILDTALPLSRANAAPQFETLEKLLKIATVLQTLKLPGSQLDWLFRENAWLVAAPDLLATHVPFASWFSLIQLQQLRQELALEDAALEAVLSATGAVAVAADELSQSAAREAFVDALARWLGWPREDVETLVGKPDDPADLGLLNARVPDAYRGLDLIVRLQRAMSLLKRLGVTAARASEWCEATVTDAHAKAIRSAAKAKHDDDAWLKLATPLQDALRDQQRGALVTYLTARPAEWPTDLEKADANDLYAHFLIDVEMSACQLTSRIKQAIGSVQLFAQRCLMGLEPDVQTNDDKWLQWEWMKNFRVWEVNRKIWLYPENWIEPELRDGKTPFFKDLENELLQTDLDDAAAEQAFLHYLEKLAEVARLQIVGVYEDDEDQALHVFGRTLHAPHIYYYRHRDGTTRSWAPWEKVEAAIEGDHLIPVVWNRTLMLIWPIFTEKAKEKAVVMPEQGGELTPADRYWEIQLAWSEYQHGRWSGKNLSGAVTLEAYQGEDKILFGNLVRAPRLANEVARRPIDDDGDVPDTHDDDDGGNGGGSSGTNTGSQGSGKSTTRRQPVSVEKILWKAFPGEEELVVRGYLRRDYRAALDGEDPRIACVFGEFRFFGCRKIVTTGHTRQILGRNFALAPAGTKFDRMWFTQTGPGLVLFDGQFPVLPNFGLHVADDTNEPASIAGDPKATLENKQGIQVLNRTPWTFRLLAPHQDLQFVVDRPVFFEDGKRTFMVTSTGTSGKTARPDLSVWVEANLATVWRANYFPPSRPALPDGNGPVTNPRPEAAPLTVLVSGPGGRRIAKEMVPVNLQQEFSRRTLLPTPWTTREYRFVNFHHPHLCDFEKTLNRQGIAALLSLDTQSELGAQSFDAYQPEARVLKAYPVDEVEFQPGGAYEGYNWELFFHIPLLIAERLKANQRFKEAQRWFHFIFDPTGASGGAVPQRYWRTLPFHKRLNDDYEAESVKTIEEMVAKGLSEELTVAVEVWRNNPFSPHAVARLRTTAYQKTVVMKYIDNLIAWGDQLFRRETLESISEATQLYVLAAEILGRRPEVIQRDLKPAVQTFNSLDLNPGGFGNALEQIELLIPDPGSPGGTEGSSQTPDPPSDTVLYFCVPENDRLLGYWSTVSDRLFKIRHCMNIEGQVRQLPLFEPPIDPALLVRARAAGLSIGDVLSDMSVSLPNYRFSFMAQKANELVAEVRNLGAALLSALEKRDAEALSTLRSGQELRLLQAVRDVRVKQIDEAEANMAGLQVSQQMAEARKQYYQTREHLSSGEKTSQDRLEQSLYGMLISGSIHGLAAVLTKLGNFKLGSPTTAGAEVGPAWVGRSMLATAAALEVASSILSVKSQLTGRMAEYDRRQDEWNHQANLATIELKQIDQQLLAAEIRLAVAEQELRNHDRQIDNARDVDQHLRDKFTNQDLYQWMIGQVSGLYFQSYQLAYELAKRAEICMQHELGLKYGETSFIRFGYWDSLKKGLLAGDHLAYNLKRLEIAYLDGNIREYELTKHVSLISLAPEQFLALKETGACEFEIPEWLFDMDTPGHYRRRMKMVGVTIPCVTGPYTGVHCKLQLLKNSFRQNTDLAPGYERRPTDETSGSDDRFIDDRRVLEAIVTSTGQNDAGLFEPVMRDERYLPFEGAGAISTWRLELPTQFRTFDYSTISDVILHLRYTARDGGNLLSTAATDGVTNLLGGAGDQRLLRLFSLRHEFPSEWHRFVSAPPSETGINVMTVDLAATRLPYFVQGREITVEKAMVMPRTNSTSPSQAAIAPGQAIPDLTQSPWTGEGDPGLWTFGTNADPKLVEDVFVIFEYSAS